AIQAHRREDDQHDAGVKEGVDVQGVNEVIDIKNVATHIENFEDKREQRNAAKHHVGEIAKEGGDEEAHFRAMLAHFFLGPGLEPFFEWSGRFFSLIENEKRS